MAVLAAKQNLDEELLRFEEELAGISPHASAIIVPYPNSSNVSMQFVPQQLLRRQGMPTRLPTIHAAPQPAHNAFSSTISEMSEVPQVFGPNNSFGFPFRFRDVPPGMPQVSANKAMLDAQKAMSMQLKEAPVMGPQVIPEELERSSLSKRKQKSMKFVRTAGGEVWQDHTLADWDPNDFRLFCGDLGNEVNDDLLTRAFKKYPSFQRAKVIRDKRTNKSKGYGFVSFSDPKDFVRATKEMNGKYVGNRPIKLRKSTWKDRQIDVVKKKTKEKAKLGMRT